MNILLVSSNLSLRSSLIHTLEENGYCTSGTHPQIALNFVNFDPYNLILLDVDQAEGDGLSLCHQLRLIGCNEPIILLLSPGSDGAAIAGFRAGANDYLEKPLDFDRFLSLMRMWSHRKPIIGGSSSANNTLQNTLNWGPLCLDLEAARVTLDGQEISLTSTEYKILELFLHNPDRIFSRSTILDRLWDQEAPTERAINTYIKDIRKKLKTAGLTAEILETVYGMGYRLKPFPSLELKLSAIAQRFWEEMPQRLTILEQTATSLRKGKLNAAMHLLAQKEMHQLAGSLATFGYPEGSRLARALDHFLRTDRQWSGDEIQKFEEQLAALKAVLSQSPDQSLEQNLGQSLDPDRSRVPLRSPALNASLSPPLVKEKRTARPTQVLVIDDDVALTQCLVTEAADWGFSLNVVPDLIRARVALKQTLPDVVLLDLSFSETEEDGLSFLADLHDRFPKLPVVIFTGRNSLEDRLTSSRLGAQGFLHKPVTIDQIFQKIQQIVLQAPAPSPKVLIVDDDPNLLDLLTTLLTSCGLTVIPLENPEYFWDVLVESLPDLVLLDVEMPTVNGLELCQVVRQDGEWDNLPLFVVTAHTDPLYLEQAFAAGADDFIPKTMLQTELIPRVLRYFQDFTTILR